MKEWSKEIKRIDPNEIDINHAMTPRYFRAFEQRHWVIKNGFVLGFKKGNSDGYYEIAVWLPHPQGTKKCGIYSALRLFYQKNILVCTEIYAFYDGNDKSICLKSFHTAQEYARKWEFYE